MGYQLAILRTAVERSGRVVLYCVLPLIAVSAVGPAHAFASWLIPLAAAVTEFALTIGDNGWRLAIRDAVVVGVEVAVPSVAFTVVWPVADVGTVGHAILVTGPAFLIATVVASVTLTSQARADELALWKLATSAADAVERDDDPAVGSSVDLDAQLAYRYQRVRKEAELEVRRFLPANPRTAKRMVNHVSLAMAIAEQRGLFRDGEITQQHLAKWIGFSEQWPALGAALTTAPERMAEIEAADPQMLQRILTELAPGTVVSKEMLDRLRDGQPLGELLDRLVRYEPG